MASVWTMLILLLVLPAAAQAPQLTPLRLLISTPQTEFKLGVPVTVDVVLQNTSNSDIAVSKANAPKGRAELTFDVDVLDGSGRRAPYTKYGRRLVGEDPTEGVYMSSQSIELKPNETLTDSVNLDQIYDLSRPGQYIVQVRKVTGKKGAKSQSVISNAIKITIKQ